MPLPRPLEELIEELMKLPGIGPKSAQRIALYIMKAPPAEARDLADAIKEAREKVKPCKICGNLTEEEPCTICRSEEREDSLLCLVEEPQDVIAFERTGYKGKYFVLNEQMSFLGGLDLRKIDFQRLQELIRARGVKEVIVATNPTIEGEVVAKYVAEVTRDLGVRVTKLAYGLPVGGDIEYVDEITLRRAFDGRSEV